MTRAPTDETRSEALTYFAWATPINIRRPGEDFTRQDAAFLFSVRHKRIADSQHPFRLTAFRSLILTRFGWDYGVSTHSPWARAQTGRNRRRTSSTYWALPFFLGRNCRN